jgi:hypothetical protein
VVALLEGELGPAHPWVGGGGLHVWEEALGPEHPRVAMVLGILAGLDAARLGAGRGDGGEVFGEDHENVTRIRGKRAGDRALPVGGGTG